MISTILTFVCLMQTADSTAIEKLTAEEFDVHLKAVGNISVEEAPHYMSVAIFHKINSYRSKKRLAPLHWEPLLQKASDLHNSEMDKYNFFNHNNHRNRKLFSPKDRVSAVGVENVKVGENIALLDIPAEDYINENNTISATHIDQLAAEFVTMWRNSKGHNENMLRSEYVYSGISCYFSKRALQKNTLKIYVTNVLITKAQD